MKPKKFRQFKLQFGKETNLFGLIMATHTEHPHGLCTSLRHAGHMKSKDEREAKEEPNGNKKEGKREELKGRTAGHEG